MILASFREPLLHFVALGALLFGVFGMFGKKSETDAPPTIIVSEGHIASLSDGFARTWRRPPSATELEALVDNYIRDEVFYREGKAAGLDRDDSVIRRRVRLKMEFLAQDLDAAEPSMEQLATYMAAHPEQFRSPDRLSFRHVFLSASRRGEAVGSDAKVMADSLDGAVTDSAGLGDPFLVGDVFLLVTDADVALTFGDGFAKRLSSVEEARWEGPIPSSHGLHFVFIEGRSPGSLPPLPVVAGAVRREWANARRIEAEQAFYRKLKDRYEIIVERQPASVQLSQAKP